MQFGGICYTIFTNTDLAYDPPELNAWDRFWQSTTGKCLAAFLLGFASVICIYTFGLHAFLAFAGMMAGSLALCGLIAGYQSYVNGKGFWRGFERYINCNWALNVAIDSIFLLIACGIKLRSSPVQNAGSKQVLPNVNKEVSDAVVETKDFVNPQDVYYTQNSIKNTFGGGIHKGNKVDDLIDALKAGTITPDNIPPIEVFEYNGKVCSINNRRLFAFKKAGITKVPVKWVDMFAMRHDFTAFDLDIIVRGGSKYL